MNPRGCRTSHLIWIMLVPPVPLASIAITATITAQLFSQFNRMLKERGIITHKGTIVDALTEEQKENNRRKSKFRCRIEHVFAYMTMSMHSLTVRSIGIERAAFNIGLTNLVYNLCRYSFLSRKEAVTG